MSKNAIVTDKYRAGSCSERVTRKFLEVSRCSRAKKRQRSVQKKCAARAKMFFC